MAPANGETRNQRGRDPPAAMHMCYNEEEVEEYDVEEASKNVPIRYVTTMGYRGMERGRANVPVNATAKAVESNKSYARPGPTIASKCGSANAVASNKSNARPESSRRRTEPRTVTPVAVEVLPACIAAPQRLQPASYDVRPPSVPRRLHEPEVQSGPTDESKSRRKCLLFTIALLLVAIIVGVVVPLVVLKPTTDDPNGEDSATKEPEEEGTVPNMTELVALFSQKNTETSKSLQDKTSAQYRAMEWLATDVLHNSYKLPGNERQIVQLGTLATLYYSTLGDKDEWVNTTGWLDHSVSECNWYGVSCEDNVVHVLDFSDDVPNKLAGTLPRELSFLDQLRVLRLVESYVGGTIPTELGSFSHLTSFNLGGINMHMNGTIPSEIFRMSSLVSLRLWENDLTGTISSDVGSMTNLYEIKLNNNLLNGTLPTEIGLWSKMENLAISRNLISGPLPSELSQCVFLQDIKLNNNHLNGTIPSELALLKGLKELLIYSNSLTGTMPAELCARNSTVLLSTDCKGDPPDPPEVVCECCAQCRADGDGF